MTAAVIVFCGRELRTAFVSDTDANGDDRSEAAASIIAQHRVADYILATGPLTSSDIGPTLWSFPLPNLVDIDLHTHVHRFQRFLGRGPNSPRANITKAIKATVRTITSAEIDAHLGLQRQPAEKAAKRGKSVPVVPGRPTQLSLFEAVGA